MADSSISKFFEKSLKDRLDIVSDFSGLSQDELKIIEDTNNGIWVTGIPNLSNLIVVGQGFVENGQEVAVTNLAKL